MCIELVSAAYNLHEHREKVINCLREQNLDFEPSDDDTLWRACCRHFEDMDGRKFTGRLKVSLGMWTVGFRSADGAEEYTAVSPTLGAAVIHAASELINSLS